MLRFFINTKQKSSLQVMISPLITKMWKKNREEMLQREIIRTQRSTNNHYVRFMRSQYLGHGTARGLDQNKNMIISIGLFDRNDRLTVTKRDECS